MTTKALFKCEDCGFAKEFSICTICYGAISFPHEQNPKCPECDGKMHLQSETVRTGTQ